MKTKVYIVGAGSFAQKLAITLKKFPLDLLGFVDEFGSETLMGLPLTKANELIFDHRALFFTAISHFQYTQNAIERLINIGVTRSKIIPLYYDSCSVYLEATLQNNFAENIVKLKNCNGNFAQYETLTCPIALDSQTISVRLLSRGSLFLSHLQPVLKALEEDENYELVSDRTNSLLGQHKLASQERMLATDSKLVITTQFFNVAPATSKKLTFLHAIYDSMMFRESIFDEIDSCDHHYIALPSKACMDYFKQKIAQKKLRNKITLIPFGYPKLDSNICAYKKLKDTSAESKLIIYAPTQSLTPNPNAPEGFSLFHARDYLLTLLNLLPNHRIILQPHPDDLVLLQEGGETKASLALKELLHLAQEHERVSIANKNQSQLELFAQSQFLISDTSSTAYTYAFTTLKPVIFLSPYEHAIIENWSHLSYIKDREQVGYICSDNAQFTTVIKKISSKIFNKRSHTKALRKSNIYNIYTSENKVIELINNITNSTTQDSWEPILGDSYETR